MALDTLGLAGAYACVFAVIVLLCLTRTTRPGFDSSRFCRFSNGRADIALMNEMNDKIDHACRNMKSAGKALGYFPLYMRTDRTDPIRNPFMREDTPGIERSDTDMTTQSTATTPATPTTGSRRSADGESRVGVRFGPKRQR
jgi:hypothetical protein